LDHCDHGYARFSTPDIAAAAARFLTLLASLDRTEHLLAALRTIRGDVDQRIGTAVSPQRQFSIGGDMDSRKSPRIPVECPLSFCAEGPAGQVIAQDTGTIRDLSSSGCSIQSPTALDKGAYLRITIALPGHDAQVDVDLAKVRWASQHDFGVEFLVLNDREQARLRGFVAFRQDSKPLTLR
jgi:hypothetical protein